MRICDRFGALPSQVLGEDADVLRMIALEELRAAEGRWVQGG